MINMNFMFELYSKPHMRGYLFTLDLVWSVEATIVTLFTYFVILIYFCSEFRKFQRGHFENKTDKKNKIRTK